MKDEVERIAEGEDEVLAVLARHREELGRSSEDCSEDDVVPGTAMGDVGEWELGMCKEVSWEEVEVLKCLGRGKAPGPDGILNEMVMYGGGRLVEVMLLQVMNLVMRSESLPADWKRSVLVPLHHHTWPSWALARHMTVVEGAIVV